MAIVNLPDASINGSKQKKADWHAQLKKEFDRLLPVLVKKNPELNNRQKIDVWRARLGRSVADQGQKGIALSRKLKGYLRIVEAQRVTGNPTDYDNMRCATGLLNNIIKTSHLYDVIRNLNYVIGKPFPFAKIFHWLNSDTSELDPTLSSEDNSNLPPPQPLNEKEVGEQGGRTGGK
ncbi:hypothetical protein FGB62_187g11 [Gracilaria domingensis]|nr:hypothetical protein FGB62_187g11 [Gracilaria domingensis]